MAVANQQQQQNTVMDLSNTGLCKIDPATSSSSSVTSFTLILDRNEISRIENLETYTSLQQLSLAHNKIVRMIGVNKLYGLRVLNLPHNDIHMIEGLRELKSLAWLNLSANTIKTIENLTHNPHLRHVDLSDNRIQYIGDLSQLTKLKTLLVHGNLITTLSTTSKYLPKSLSIFSLAENKISDLTEVSYLTCLNVLEQLSVMNNPCVLPDDGAIKFDHRPYIINWCLELQILDGKPVTHRESLKAEWLYSQGKGRAYHPGQHIPLQDYLTAVCPPPAELQSTEDIKLNRVLNKQLQYQKQLQSTERSGLGGDGSHDLYSPIDNPVQNSPRSIANSNNIRSQRNNTPDEQQRVLRADTPSLHRHFTPGRDRLTQDDCTVVTQDVKKPSSSTGDSIEIDVRITAGDDGISPPDEGDTIDGGGGIRQSDELNVGEREDHGRTPSPGVPLVSESRYLPLNESLSPPLPTTHTTTEGEACSLVNIMRGELSPPLTVYNWDSSLYSRTQPAEKPQEVSVPSTGIQYTDIGKPSVITPTPNPSTPSNRPNSVPHVDTTAPVYTTAAIRIQAVWRGYKTRCLMPSIVEMLNNIKMKRLAQYCTHLQAELLRMSKLFTQSRDIQKIQQESTRYLWKQVAELTLWRDDLIERQILPAPRPDDDEEPHPGDDNESPHPGDDGDGPGTGETVIINGSCKSSPNSHSLDNDDTVSLDSNTEYIDLRVLPAPSGLTAECLTYDPTGTLLASWTPPPLEQGSELTRYHIYIDNIATTTVLPNQNTAIIPDLKTGVSYKLSVRAVTSAGESPHSNIVEVFIPSSISTSN